MYSNDLSWYIVNPGGNLAKVLKTQSQLTSWVTVVLTPLQMVFEMMGSELEQSVLWLYWVIDILWCLEIIFCFFIASQKNRKFADISKSYLKGFFIIDFLATIPPMITMQKSNSINMLKYLRFAHVTEMFTPFKRLIDCLMSGSIARKRSDMFKMIVLMTAVGIFGHIMACCWIALGMQEDGWITMLRTPSE